jgi:tetratricopeptide (TPR) repeat protein
LLACTTPTAAPPASTEPTETSDLTSTLLRLGNEALTTSDYELARQRFERATQAAPTSGAAWAGLGRALAGLGKRDEARAALDTGLARAPDTAELHVGRADLAILDGDAAAARRHLERAVAIDPSRTDAHERLAKLTGLAPRGADLTGDAAVASAAAHPYDPRARLAAGEALLARGDAAAAREHLETALVLADLDPPAGARAAERLRASQPDWRERRVVWVHALADEVLRSDPAWRFQLRLAWLVASQSIEPLTGVRFVVSGTGAFTSEGAGFDLPPIAAAARAQHPRPPDTGVLFVATGRPIPRVQGAWKQGEAELLGRALTVRLARGEVTSRVLVHELIHLFGGVHVNPEVDALMNPTGKSVELDPWNAAILRATRNRTFGPGGLERNVLARVDLATTIEAYRAALRANVMMRNAGIVDALESNRGSARAAGVQIGEAKLLDEHLGDVASLLAHLLLRDGQPAGATRMWLIAARLYGPGDARARLAIRNARALGAAVGR